MPKLNVYGKIYHIQRRGDILDKRLIIKSIESMISTGRLLLAQLEVELSKYNGGTLIIRNRNGHITYSERIGTMEKGITKNTERIDVLIRRTRLKNSIKQTKEIVSILEIAVSKLEKIGTKKINQLISNELDAKSKYSPEDWQWMKADYSSNPLYAEELKYETLLGIRVRTKSEWLIAMVLEMLGIPYRYEQLHYIGGKAYYPDFTIKKADGTIIIWEHFGLMNDPEYVKKADMKILNYVKAGFRQHKNLICTYEEDIQSQECLIEIACRFFYH